MRTSFRCVEMPTRLRLHGIAVAWVSGCVSRACRRMASYDMVLCIDGDVLSLGRSTRSCRRVRHRYQPVFPISFCTLRPCASCAPMPSQHLCFLHPGAAPVFFLDLFLASQIQRTLSSGAVQMRRTIVCACVCVQGAPPNVVRHHTSGCTFLHPSVHVHTASGSRIDQCKKFVFMLTA